MMDRWKSSDSFAQQYLLLPPTMAEAMAVIGLVASVLQLVDTVAKAGTFMKDLHNAPKEQKQLLSEITSLQPLLTALQQRLLSSTSAAATHIKDPLSAFEDTMKRYNGKLQADGVFSKVSKPISWTLWNKKEAKDDLDQVERFKSLLNTWLTVDIWYGSRFYLRFLPLDSHGRDIGQQHDSERNHTIQMCIPPDFFKFQIS
jgi:hypothetical protein